MVLDVSSVKVQNDQSLLTLETTSKSFIEYYAHK